MLIQEYAYITCLQIFPNRNELVYLFTLLAGAKCKDLKKVRFGFTHDTRHNAMRYLYNAQLGTYWIKALFHRLPPAREFSFA